MKSKISIDVDYNNNPIIKIEHIASSDVRDKLVERFLHQFRYDSCWAKFKYDSGQEITQSSDPDQNAVMAVIIPLTPLQLSEEVENIKRTIEDIEQRKTLQNIEPK